jgi:hypothetical protein
LRWPHSRRALTPFLITAAAVIAALAAFRAVMLGYDLDDANVERLGRAIVAHGAAVVALGAIVVVGGGLPWALDILAGALALAWGGTLILVGRSYDTSPERLAAELRDERRARARPIPKRFGRLAAERQQDHERSGRSQQT